MKRVGTTTDGRLLVSLTVEEAQELTATREVVADAMKALDQLVVLTDGTMPDLPVGGALSRAEAAVPPAPRTDAKPPEKPSRKKRAPRPKARPARKPEGKSLVGRVEELLSAHPEGMTAAAIVETLTEAGVALNAKKPLKQMGILLAQGKQFRKVRTEGPTHRGVYVLEPKGKGGKGKTAAVPEEVRRHLTAQQRLVVDADEKKLTAEGKRRRLELIRELNQKHQAP